MKIIKQIQSKDGKTTKFLQQTHDRHIIETSFFNLEESIVCISTQIGCPMGCIFCATTEPIDAINPNLRFIRNLTCKEISQQIINVLKNKIGKRNASKPILLSYMGMGESFLNYNNVTCSIKNISLKYKKVKQATIATSGILPSKIRRLANERFNIKVKIQLSLHAPTERLRKKIMPGSKSIQKALRAMKYYSKIKGEPVKINYMLMNGINDSDKNAHDLIKLLHRDRKNFIVKLIILNESGKCKPSSENRFNKFRALLEDAGMRVVKFAGNGLDIKASCGQLRRHYYQNKDFALFAESMSI